MTTPESRVKAKVRKVLQNLNAYYVMPVTSGYGNSGAPDYLVCFRSKFIGIECKAGGNQPTALQYKNLKAIQDNGGEALIVTEDNVNQLHEVLRGYEDA